MVHSVHISEHSFFNYFSFHSTLESSFFPSSCTHILFLYLFLQLFHPSYWPQIYFSRILLMLIHFCCPSPFPQFFSWNFISFFKLLHPSFWPQIFFWRILLILIHYCFPSPFTHILFLDSYFFILLHPSFWAQIFFWRIFFLFLKFSEIIVATPSCWAISPLNKSL